MLHHIACYTGWPRAISAVPVVTVTLAARQAPARTNADVGILRPGEAPVSAGLVERFAGAVLVGPLFQTEDPARMGGGHVAFETGGHTAWQTHPLGQTLCVTGSCSLV